MTNSNGFVTEYSVPSRICRCSCGWAVRATTDVEADHLLDAHTATHVGAVR